ncbi:hypothetical protein [uncultured Paraglaciecola sp.]|uniref:hypothetical protein n=1 Tax=uncultured Paraglaciecola sp. TaxID=1765024 RepID=UPI00261F1DCD|nr:hypothetical protein [uncultured Paraglaciecola sp.]
MKQIESFPKPETLLRQIANCDDQLAHMPDVDPEWLKVSCFVSLCGTYRCWLGDYFHRKGIAGKFRSAMYRSTADRHVRWAFGGCIYSPVFTDEYPYTTQFRKAALKTHRDTLQAKVDAWYQQREVQAEIA